MLGDNITTRRRDRMKLRWNIYKAKCGRDSSENSHSGSITISPSRTCESFIGTLDDLDMAKQLMMLHLQEAYDMIRATSASALTPFKSTRAVRAIHVESGCSDSDSDLNGSGFELDRRKVCMTTVPDRVKNFGERF